MSTRSGESGTFRPPGGGYAHAAQREEFPRGADRHEEFPRTTGTTDFRLQPPERRRPSWMAVGVVLAIVLAVAALVVGVVSLVTQPAPTPAVSAPSPQAMTDADKALCQAIGPLMKEND